MRNPKQKRSAESLEKVIQAAEKILRSHSLDDLTVAKLVEDSGVSVGAIYARFADKEGIFQELVSRFMRHTLREFEKIDSGQWADMALPAAIDKIVSTNADIYFTHRGVLRALILRIKLTRDLDIQKALGAYSRKVGTDLLTLLQVHVDQIEHADPTEAINVSIETMTSMLRDYIILSETDTFDARGVERTQSLIKRYLQPSQYTL